MQVLILSPHRDDAAFSCGLTLHSLLRTGSNLTVVNVFTISRYAPYLTQRTSDSFGEVTELRKEEDCNFHKLLCKTAGVNSSAVEFHNLGWEDVPLRWRIEDVQSIAPLNVSKDEVHTLMGEFSRLPQADIVLVPMALGGHLDHRLVLQAAFQAFSAASLVFYEDLPYACRLSSEDRAFTRYLGDISLGEVWLPFQKSSAGLKRAFALCYPSQIAADVANEMERHAAQYGGRERLLAGSEAVLKLQIALQQGVPS